MSQQSNYIDPLTSLSQDFDIQGAQPSMRTRHLTLAQMRGVIPLFNQYFKQVDEFGNKKKISRNEKQKRWISYKNKIWRDYGRVIKGTFLSEQALVRRCSDPLTFLKYKLKRATNLKVTDLSPEDQEYYKEIGGLDDVNELIARQKNIDSIQKLYQPPQKRRRITMVRAFDNNQRIQTPEIQILTTNNAYNHNARNYNNPNISQQFGNNHNNTDSNRVTSSNLPLNANVTTVKIDDNATDNIDVAINKLNEDLDVFEQEQLLKKKIEAYEITQEKMKAIMASVKILLGNQPEMIGSIPGVGSLEDQLTLGFDFWLNQYKITLLEDVVDVEMFIEQLNLLKSDPKDFIPFLQKWKLIRILKNDVFSAIWKWICDELNIECKSDKEEMN